MSDRHQVAIATERGSKGERTRERESDRKISAKKIRRWKNDRTRATERERERERKKRGGTEVRLKKEGK